MLVLFVLLLLHLLVVHLLVWLLHLLFILHLLILLLLMLLAALFCHGLTVLQYVVQLLRAVLRRMRTTSLAAL